MDKHGIELHIRKSGDGATLRALKIELEHAGSPAVLTRAPDLTDPETAELPIGPRSCRVRVVVAGAAAPSAPPAEHRVVIEDRPTPADAAHESSIAGLSAADLILVAGHARQRALTALSPAPVVACGLPRLDAMLGDPARARADARRQLGLPESAAVLLYAPRPGAAAGAPWPLEQALGRITCQGFWVLIVPEGWPRSWIDSHRALAARSAGAALIEQVPLDRALAAADIVLTDDAALGREAELLGRAVVQLEGVRRLTPSPPAGPIWESAQRAHDGASLEAALRSVDPRASERTDPDSPRIDPEQLVAAGRAARGAAEAIHTRFSAPPAADASGSTAATPGSDEDRLLQEVEARVAFGDTVAALAMLDSHLARTPSPRAYRLLARIARRDGRIETARSALAKAEPLAREELGRTLCEQGSLLAGTEEVKDARRAFEQARELAPQLAEPWIGLGSLTLFAGDPVSAEREFRQALEREKSTRVWSGIGLSLAAQGRGRDAMVPLEAALELEADHLPTVFGLVQAGFQCGELAPVERRVAAFVELHSGNLDMAFTLAGLRYQLGDLSGAREMIERIELFRPDYPGLGELRAKLVA